jgi:hypothetical protein
MTQTFLIAAPAKTANGKAFRVVKDRSWDDMPWNYLVQTLQSNYQHGRMHTRWVYTHKFATRDEALEVFRKKVAQ